MYYLIYSISTLEIRGDAFKLCFIHQRPFGARVNSIGSWQNAMELMGIVGVMVNCALIGKYYMKIIIFML